MCETDKCNNIYFIINGTLPIIYNQPLIVLSPAPLATNPKLRDTAVQVTSLSFLCIFASYYALQMPFAFQADTNTRAYMTTSTQYKHNLTYNAHTKRTPKTHKTLTTRTRTRRTYNAHIPNELFGRNLPFKH